MSQGIQETKEKEELDRLAELINTNLPQPPTLQGPYGPTPLVYADWTASGRSLQCIERIIQNKVLPWYANTHSEESIVGQQTNLYREEARQKVKSACSADERHACLFVGSGSTGAINKLVDILGMRMTEKQKREEESKGMKGRDWVFFLPWEHHSNLLVWRETSAILIEIPLSSRGTFSLPNLTRALLSSLPHSPKRLITSLSACSNITGQTVPMRQVAQRVHQFGGLCFFDCAAYASHANVCMVPRDERGGEIEGAGADAVFLSPHKLHGGPGTPGILFLHKNLVRPGSKPTRPGGGVVEYVSRTGSIWIDDIERKEEEGTPDIIGSIRAGLVFDLKSTASPQLKTRRSQSILRKVIARWSKCPEIVLLGPTWRAPRDSATATTSTSTSTRSTTTARMTTDDHEHEDEDGDEDQEEYIRFPIISFKIKGLAASYVNVLLNDLFGIQARSGCFCAHPYHAHLLPSLSLSPAQIQTQTQSQSQSYAQTQTQTRLLALTLAQRAYRPSSTRVSFHWSDPPGHVEYIVRAVEWVGRWGWGFLGNYEVGLKTGGWGWVGPGAGGIGKGQGEDAGDGTRDGYKGRTLMGIGKAELFLPPPLPSNPQPALPSPSSSALDIQTRLTQLDSHLLLLFSQTIHTPPNLTRFLRPESVLSKEGERFRDWAVPVEVVLLILQCAEVRDGVGQTGEGDGQIGERMKERSKRSWDRLCFSLEVQSGSMGRESGVSGGGRSEVEGQVVDEKRWTKREVREVREVKRPFDKIRKVSGGWFR